MTRALLDPPDPHAVAGGGRARDPRHGIRTLELFAGGSWMRATSPLLSDVIRPSDGAPLAHLPLASRDDVDQVVRAVAAKAPSWRGAGPETRHAVLERLQAELQRRKARLTEIILDDTGWSTQDANDEVARAFAVVAAAAASSPPAQRVDFANHAKEEVTLYLPVGLVAAITPASHPLSEAAWWLTEALKYGASIVLHPDWRAPLAVEELVRASLAAGVPGGALGLVHGDVDTSERLATHAQIDAVAVAGAHQDTALIADAATCTRKPLRWSVPRKAVVLITDGSDLVATAQQVVTDVLVRGGVHGMLPPLVLHVGDAYLALERALVEACQRAASNLAGPEGLPWLHPASTEEQRMVADLVADDGQLLWEPSDAKAALRVVRVQPTGVWQSVVTRAPLVCVATVPTIADTVALLRSLPCVHEVIAPGGRANVITPLLDVPSLRSLRTGSTLDPVPLAARERDHSCLSSPPRDERQLLTRTLSIDRR